MEKDKDNNGILNNPVAKEKQLLSYFFEAFAEVEEDPIARNTLTQEAKNKKVESLELEKKYYNKPLKEILSKEQISANEPRDILKLIVLKNDYKALIMLALNSYQELEVAKKQNLGEKYYQCDEKTTLGAEIDKHVNKLNEIIEADSLLGKNLPVKNLSALLAHFSSEDNKIQFGVDPSASETAHYSPKTNTVYLRILNPSPIVALAKRDENIYHASTVAHEFFHKLVGNNDDIQNIIREFSAGLIKDFNGSSMKEKYINAAKGLCALFQNGESYLEDYKEYLSSNDLEQKLLNFFVAHISEEFLANTISDCYGLDYDNITFLQKTIISKIPTIQALEVLIAEIDDLVETKEKGHTELKALLEQKIKEALVVVENLCTDAVIRSIDKVKDLANQCDEKIKQIISEPLFNECCDMEGALEDKITELSENLEKSLTEAKKLAVRFCLGEELLDSFDSLLGQKPLIDLSSIQAERMHKIKEGEIINKSSSFDSFDLQKRKRVATNLWKDKIDQANKGSKFEESGTLRNESLKKIQSGDQRSESFREVEKKRRSSSQGKEPFSSK